MVEFTAAEITEQLKNLREICEKAGENVELDEKSLSSLENFLVKAKKRVESVRKTKKEVEAREKERREEEARIAEEKEEVESVRQRLQESMFDPPEDLLSNRDDETIGGSDMDPELLQATSNTPSVDFLSFIESDGASSSSQSDCGYLMFEKSEFSAHLSNALHSESLRYPLGVAYDEELKLWIVCERNQNKIMVINVETEAITFCDGIKNPTAVTIYKEGWNAAVLTNDGPQKYEIYIYNYNTKEPFLKPFASYKHRIFDINHQLRGLAKSIGGSLLSLEMGSKAKRLRVFDKDLGGKGFDIPGAQSPSFIATYRSTVAVSDLGCNKVFIINLEDSDWENISFHVIHVICTTPQIPIDQLANQTGFMFVAGMQFDINGFLLIGDARGHSMKLYDTSYQFLHRVSSNFVIPYVSSFHVNRAGECILLDVNGSSRQKIQFVKMTSINDILPWVAPSQGARGSSSAVAFKNHHHNQYRGGGSGNGGGGGSNGFGGYGDRGGGQFQRF
uniref:WD_REPEATS_REGION domain-containing protein n=1 Tax=Caenorhabditis tropicalis TaxID=1561998 RepID=A0A1I7TR03_9PELO